MPIYYAHSKPEQSPFSENNKEDWHLLRKHLVEVGKEAAKKAQCWEGKDEAQLAGLLHDLGKYSDNFQKRLEGETSGVNHWSQGAIWSWENQAWLAAFAIYGHHVGIPSVSVLRKLGKDPKHENPTWNMAETLQELKNRFSADGLVFPSITPTTIPIKEKSRFAMAVRMLFSALCDADFIDTEDHFNKYLPKNSRPSSAGLEAEKALKLLLNYINQKPEPKDPKKKIIYDARQLVLHDCLNKAKENERLFTLTAPTGSGKTLSSLAFALQHAATRELRRIIIVIPYLSIIEQTANEFRKIFKPVFGESYVLEHHSMTDRTRVGNTNNEEKDAEDQKERNRRLLSQNWDAPIVITTSVQFFESLFSNKSTTCRKLHNIAKSVVYFDEAQTLPPNLAISTLEALNALMRDYGVTVVFGTATQPAFKTLSDQILGGWQPKEIIENKEQIFSALKRIQPVWPATRDERMDWAEVSDELRKRNQALCIVNLKKHAAELMHTMMEVIPNERQGALYHLSTALCPAHRQVILKEVRTKLGKGEQVYLIATQCIEAGVDIDFPVVWRAMGPLEALAQAFGRCNREGNLDSYQCEARIFIPEDADIPMRDYAQSASITSTHFWKADLSSQFTFDSYFKKLYSYINIEDGGGNMQQSLKQSINQLDFPEIARKYRLIAKDTVSIVVPFSHGKELCQKLEQSKGLNTKALRGLLHQAQPFVVNVYKNQLLWNKELQSSVIPVPGNPHGGWYLWRRNYDEKLGIFTKAINEILIA